MGQPAKLSAIYRSAKMDDDFEKKMFWMLIIDADSTVNFGSVRYYSRYCCCRRGAQTERTRHRDSHTVVLYTSIPIYAYPQYVLFTKLSSTHVTTS